MALLRKGILAGGGAIICSGIGVGTNMILSRVLLPEGMGRYQVPLTAGVLTMTLLSLGIGQSNIFFLNKHRIEHKRIVMNSVWFGLAGSAVLLLSVPMLLSFFRDYFGVLRLSTRFIFSIGLAALLCFCLLRPVLTADLKVRQDVGVRITNKFMILLTVVVCVVFWSLSVDAALIAASIGPVAALALVIYFLRGHFDFSILFSWKLFTRILSYGLKMFAANLVYFVNVSLGLMLLRLLIPDDFTDVGYYGRAVSVCALIMLLPSSVGPLLYARWSALSGRQRSAQVELAMRLHFAAGSAIAGILILLGPLIITTLYGKSFLPAVGPMRVLALGVAFRCVFCVCINLFAGDGRAHVTAYVFALSVGVITILTFVLVPHMGIVGAALADVIASGLVLSIGLLLLKRDYGLELTSMVMLRRGDLLYLFRALSRG
jgi:O-antigen/teichoic acid export membrane protein